MCGNDSNSKKKKTLKNTQNQQKNFMTFPLDEINLLDIQGTIIVQEFINKTLDSVVATTKKKTIIKKNNRHANS